MAVGRNDPCPCGSGHKFKNCCLQKENVEEMATYKREQFYQAKQQLVEKIGRFLESKIFHEDYKKMKNEFVQRTNGQIQDEIEESFFIFWTFFYYRFSDGLRGIDWFKNARGKNLEVKEKRMLDVWVDMQPRFLQLTDIEGRHVIFEDKDTKERFPVSTDSENLPHQAPWLSTFGMIEEFDGFYYFNGFWMGVEPAQLNKARTKAAELVQETGLSHAEVYEQYFLEIITALLDRNVQNQVFEREVYEYHLSYSIENSLYVTEFLRDQKDFKINKWEKDDKELVWAGNWRVYHDSECELPVKLADVFGTIKVKNFGKTLTFETMQEEYKEQMKNRLATLGKKLILTDETASLIGTTTKETHNTMVSMDDEVPQYFALFAQDDLFQEAEQPIPMYEGDSLRDLQAKGETGKMEAWLRNAEFVMYKQVLAQQEQVEVTANFNSIRSSLGLPPSPFVTGGAYRQTTIEPIELEDKSPRLMEEDIPYLEELGFRPETIDQFYISDFIRFYKERVVGKSESTKRKYRTSLYDLRALLEQKTLFRWEQCNDAFWQAIVTEEHPALYDKSPGKTETKSFISTLRMFLEWLDQTETTDLFGPTVEWLKTEEK